MAITMAGNTSSKYNNPDAYWCPDCDYKTNEELIEAIEVWKIYKLLQRMKTKEVSTGF